MEDNDNLNNYFINSSRLINKNIHLYLIILFEYIFLKKKHNYSFQFEEHLRILTDKINEKIIKKKEKYIKLKEAYNIENFKNIIYFVNSQNKKLAGEIIEGILIIIFSKAFKVEKDKTFGKYIFNNIHKLKDRTNYELADWFPNANNKFINSELHDISNLLSLDHLISTQQFDDELNKFQSESPFFNLLWSIYKYKYVFPYRNYNNESKTLYYINRGRGAFNNQKWEKKFMNL